MESSLHRKNLKNLLHTVILNNFYARPTNNILMG